MIEAMKQALEALENNRQTHHYCEDTWYSCPKHEEGCANDSEGDECNCGADKANIEIDAAITSLRQAIREHAMYEVQRLGQEIEQEPVACDGDFPEGFDKSLDIPAQALRQANAALCEVTNNRMWDVPALAERMLMFCRNTHPPQHTEQNFCPRCGKRTNDIHTCTPPTEKNNG